MNTFTIKAQLPSLNTVISANRNNRYEGGRLKSDVEEVIGWAIRQALVMKKLRPVTNPCVVFIDWHEKTKRRDADNIQSSVKFILDAMVNNRILKNDSRRYVKQIRHEIIDDTDDFVVVRIEELKGES